MDDRVAINVLDTSPDALLELLFRSHPYVAQDRAGEMRNTIYSDRPIPQADNRLSTKRKPFCSNNRHIIGRENARKVVAAFEPFLDLRFHASFVNRQTRTKSVRCGLARPAPNWSGGWQRIINKELGRMAGHNVRKRTLDSLKKTVILRSGFEALYFSAAHHLMRPFVAGSVRF